MEATAELKSIMPPDSTFILIDQEGFGEKFSEGRNRIPFLERDGVYNGIPASDEEAITAFKNLQSNKPAYLVIGWPSFWWLDHFKQFNLFLQRYPCIKRNERLIVFKLL